MSNPSYPFTPSTNDNQRFGFKLTADGAQYKLWKQIIDANIKTLIYNTCDHHLLQIVFKENCSAQQLLTSIDEFFVTNNMSRSLQIHEMFRTMTKGDMNVSDFCHTLKNLCDALNDIDSDAQISETELVMQILHQLPPSYHSVVDSITKTKPFPNFYEVKNMLVGHELRETYTKHVIETAQNSNLDMCTNTPRNDSGRRRQKKNGKKKMDCDAPEVGNGNEFAKNMLVGDGEKVQDKNSNLQHSQQAFYSDTPQKPTPSVLPSRHGQQQLADHPPRAAAAFGDKQQLPSSQPHFTAQTQQFGPALGPQHNQYLGSQSFQFEQQYGQQYNPFNQFEQDQFWQSGSATYPPYRPHGSRFAGNSFGQATAQNSDLTSVISQTSLQLPNADQNYNMDTGPTSQSSHKSKKIMVGNDDVSPVTHTDTTKINFQGHIVYSRTFSEVEKATDDLLKLIETKYKDGGRAVIGLDIEWKPSFRKGQKESKAAVLQMCADTTSCHVMHIIHSGFPQNLQNLLGDTTVLKVGVGIVGDARKVFKDHNVSVEALQDLSLLANQKFGGKPKMWGLSSLTEKLTSKQIPKPKKITLGNWETNPLSGKQIKYAATDAYVSLFLFEVLNRLPDANTLTKKAGEAMAPS